MSEIRPNVKARCCQSIAGVRRSDKLRLALVTSEDIVRAPPVARQPSATSQRSTSSSLACANSMIVVPIVLRSSFGRISAALALLSGHSGCKTTWVQSPDLRKTRKNHTWRGKLALGANAHCRSVEGDTLVLNSDSYVPIFRNPRSR